MNLKSGPSETSGRFSLEHTMDDRIPTTFRDWATKLSEQSDKRERSAARRDIASKVLGALTGAQYHPGNEPMYALTDAQAKNAAQLAVKLADALLAELDKGVV
jgi:hypothetical protein